VYTDWWLVGIVFLNLGVRLSAPTSAAKEQSFEILKIIKYC
jgi:hypothetical protein